MKSGHILVVDDQIELAENIAEILQGIGFETEVAGSAEAGLERVAQGGITAVVTDYKLPGQNGAHLIEELRRRGERIPVLMMSAYTDEATIDRSRAAGAWLFLPKPVPLQTLVETFQSLAQRPAAALVVDDEVNLAENLAEALTAAGHDVVVSHTAAEALGAPAASPDGRPRLPIAGRERDRPCSPAAGTGSIDPDPLHFGVRGRPEGGDPERSGPGRHAGEAARHRQRRLLGPARRQTFVRRLKTHRAPQISRSARTTPPSAFPIGEPESRAETLHPHVRLQDVGVNSFDPLPARHLDEAQQNLRTHAAALPRIGDEQRELRLRPHDPVTAQTPDRDHAPLSTVGTSMLRDQSDLPIVVGKADAKKPLVCGTGIQLHPLHVAHPDALLAERLVKRDQQRFVLRSNRPDGQRRSVAARRRGHMLRRVGPDGWTGESTVGDGLVVEYDAGVERQEAARRSQERVDVNLANAGLLDHEVAEPN